MEVEAVVRRQAPAPSSAAAIAATSAASKRTVLRLARLHQASPSVGCERDRAAIGGDAVVGLADGLQHMAVAHPHLGLVGLAVEHLVR